jgi:site-specific recombinase XerC
MKRFFSPSSHTTNHQVKQRVVGGGTLLKTQRRIDSEDNTIRLSASGTDLSERERRKVMRQAVKKQELLSHPFSFHM